MRALVSAAVFVSGLVAVLGGVAQAASIAYEGVQYPAGALAGDGPPLTPGFMGPWMADPGVSVVGAGLSSPLDLPSMGGGVTGGFHFEAPLSATQAPTSGKEFWASFLMFQGQLNDEAFMGLSQAAAPFGDPPKAAFGVLLGKYGIFVGTAFTASAKGPSAATDLLVAHFTAGAASWNMQLFVNPTSFAIPDLVLNVPPVPFATMVNLNEPGIESDEFRLGDGPGDVAAVGSVGVGPESAPTGVELSVVPSPSHGVSRIGFTVPHEAAVRISVVDVEGRTVATLADAVYSAGRHEATWNARAGAEHVPAGLYFVRFDSLGRTTSRKVILTP